MLNVRFSETTPNAATTEKSLWEIRRNEKKPISRERHPHIHFREIDRLMYPLKSPHPSPHHLSPVFNEAFRSNLTSLNIQEYEKRNRHGLDYMNDINFSNKNITKNLEDILSKPNSNGSISEEKLRNTLKDLLISKNYHGVS